MADQDGPRRGPDGETWEDETKLVHFSTSQPGGSAAEGDQAYLIVLAGSRVGTMVKVTDGLTIGRGARAGFQTLDEGVSRSHVRITEDDQGNLYAEDQGSRNGTYVNGDLIQRVQLKDGDKIQIGSTTILKFSYADRLEESFQQQMYDAALRDPLTQIFNRRHFDEQFLVEFSYSVRHLVPLSLIMMDLDHFKLVNDRHGHPVGDSVLVSLAEILVRSTRKEDIFARYGGEEFALLCRDTSNLKAYSVANRIRRAVEQATMVADIPELKITVSAGVAGIPDASITSAEELLEAADKALYQAKALGRNRVYLYDPDMDPDSISKENEEIKETTSRLDTQKIK
jgi:diguanylate cyclase (GGDEF)-like protein